MTASATRVTVVVTQRESFVHTKRSLESLYATTQVPFDLVYVDAGSPPPTRRYLHAAAARFGFTLVRRDGFLTPNEARNLGMSDVATEYVVFAENDVLFAAGWLEALVACADAERAAVVGPLITFRDPEFTIVHSIGGAQRFERSAAGTVYRNVQRSKPAPLTAVAGLLERERVDFVEFHCLLARTDVVRRSGPFDEALTSCLEFDDFCLTVTRAGERIAFEPAARVHHMLPVPPPRGIGDLRFLRARWAPASNAASMRHFCRKWEVRDDEAFVRGIVAWCDARPYTVVANTPLYRALRWCKRRLAPAFARPALD